MATYKLHVNIDDSLVAEMKQLQYALCVAKKVNNSYTVVWTSKRDYNSVNDFSWVDEYQVGAIQSFEDGESLLKKTTTTPKKIAFGQTVVRGTDGLLKDASGQPSGASFTVDNQGGLVHLMVNQKIGEKFQTVWADPIGVINGPVELKPRPKVMVFFSRDMETATMFVSVKSTTKEIDYTGSTEQTVAYVPSTANPGTAIWVDGPGGGGANFVEPIQLQYSGDEGFIPIGEGEAGREQQEA